MSTGSFAHKPSDRFKAGRRRIRIAADRAKAIPTRDLATHTRLFVVSRYRTGELSPWSRSRTKRLFDCACVLCVLPLVLPILLIVALAVRVTSRGPIFFLQKRVGCAGRMFTILKFRTIIHDVRARYHAVTTADNQPFTPIGIFLRRWKLDELPQVLNVLMGHMSLVGPRPKMPEHVTAELSCRPGITGAATIAFACEESVLERIPKHQLNAYYHEVILPAKRRLDSEYMARATFVTDFKLLFDSVLRRWDRELADELLTAQVPVEIEVALRAGKAQIEEPVAIEQAAAESPSLRTGTM